MHRERSDALWQRAQRVIPGGVNSPVRAFRAVGGQPLFVRAGCGAEIVDVDGNRYLDYVGSWGPLILGHAPPPVVEAVTEAVRRGTSFGAPTELEVELAEAIVARMPAVEMVRLVNSGTEAVMSALRVARAATGRRYVLKFEGCYHGHSDGLLSRAGSGLATLGLPDSPGVPAEFAALTLHAPFNDLEATERTLRAHAGEVAAIIVEPVAGNMGVVPPAPGFLAGLRRLTREHGALLVFDEVITGFRVAAGGAQERYGIEPDLTVLGKIVGGGFPLAAYAGRRDLMEQVAPAGPVYQAGTLSGNPVAVTAGLVTLRELARPGIYERLESLGARLELGLREAATAAGVPATIHRVGSMLTLFFTSRPVTDFATARTADTARYGRFFHAMLRRGISLPPSQFEAMFLSTAHTEADVDRTVAAAAEALAESHAA